MQVAIDVSRSAITNENRKPFGAIIVKNEPINTSIHAEVLPIRNACKYIKSLDLSGCEIYTSSEPCPMCLGAIHWTQISSMLYYKGIITSNNITHSSICNKDSK